MSDNISVSIIELMEKAEQWLLDHGYKKKHTRCLQSDMEQVPSLFGIAFL